MECKIGEIFERNGEWYQCVAGDSCFRCDLHKPNLSASQCDYRLYCLASKRKDHKSIIFKRLEKLGEPFERNGYMYQEYKVHTFPLLMNGDAKIPTPNGFAVIIKQNKEDMKTVRISKDDLNFLVNKIRYGILPKHTDCNEIIAEITDLFSVEDVNLSNSENIGKNLKPFDLQAAKSGKPVCTRDGRKVRIICFDSKNDPRRPIVALVEHNDNELLYEYTIKGKECFSHISTTGTSDLMMLPEKKEGWIVVKRSDIYENEEIAKEAFLALMQLRQLRKAWVGDWERPNSKTYIAAIAYNVNNTEVFVKVGNYWSNKNLSFPTQEMAEDFLSCFKELCETAKILL